MARPRKQQLPEPSTRALIYARVSTKEQESEGYSIEAQLDLLRCYCAQHRLQIVREFVEADSASKTGREEFAKMVAAIKCGTASIIVAEKTDRMYRGIKDWLTIDELQACGAELHLVKENTVLSKGSRSHEKFIHGIKVLVAKNYVDNLREETAKGMNEKAKQGIWPSVAPLGYVNVSRGAKRVIQLDPATAPGIAKLFELYATGNYNIKRAVTEAQILANLRTRTGRNVAIGCAHLILQNPIYIGIVKWNGVTYPGEHEPIVDIQTFNSVQAVLRRRQNNSAGGSAKPEFAYRGIFRCGVCGCSITPELKKGHHYYHCTGLRGCRRISIREEALDQQIAAHLEGLTIRPRTLAVLRVSLKEAQTEQKATHASTLELLIARKRNLHAKLEQLYIDRVDGKVPHSAYDSLKENWERELLEVESLIAAAERASRATWEDNVRMLEMVSNAAERFKSANAERRREMVKSLFSNPQICDGTLVAELKPWFKLVFEVNAIERETDSNEVSLQVWLPAKDSNLD